MVSLLASPSAAAQVASSPSRFCAGTRQLQPWNVSLSGDRILPPLSVRCHAGQRAFDVSPSSSHRRLPSISVNARLNSASHYSLDLRVLACKKFASLNQSKMNAAKSRRCLSVCCEYGDSGRGSGGGDFFAGFLVGGAIIGTITYIFAPQIRRSLLNEDEYGFRRARKPIYYDEGFEKTRQTLNEKISQLNSAIDNVSSRLRGRGNHAPGKESIEADSEFEASV